MSKESIPPISSIPEDLRTMDFSGKTVEEFDVIEKRIGALFTPDMSTEDSAELNDILEEIELLKNELKEKAQKDEPKTTDVSEVSAKTAKTSGSKEKPRKIEASGSIASSIRTGLGTPIGIDKKSLAAGLQWVEEQFRWDKLNDPENADLKEKLEMRKAEILKAQKDLNKDSQGLEKAEATDKKTGGVVERANEALARPLNTLTTDAECKEHLKELDTLMVELSANAEDEEQKAIRAKISEKKDQVYMLGQQIRRGRGPMLDEMKKSQTPRVEKLSAEGLSSKERELNGPISEQNSLRAVHIEVLETMLKDIDEHAGDERYADHPELRSRIVNRIKEVQQYGEDAKEERRIERWLPVIGAGNPARPGEAAELQRLLGTDLVKNKSELRSSIEARLAEIESSPTAETNKSTVNQEEFTPEEEDQLTKIEEGIKNAHTAEEQLALCQAALLNPLVKKEVALKSGIEKMIGILEDKIAENAKEGNNLAENPETKTEEEQAQELGENAAELLGETPEEKTVIKRKFWSFKENGWKQTKTRNIMGVPVPELLASFVAGAALSGAVKAGLRASLGLGPGALLGATAGTITGGGIALYKENKRVNIQRAEIEEKNAAGVDMEKLKGLKGKERLSKYIEMASAGDEGRKKEIELEFDKAKISKKTVVTAALRGLVIGAIGGFLASYFLGGGENASENVVAHHTLAQNQALIEAKAHALKAAAVAPSAPVPSSVEIPDDVTDSFRGLKGGDIAAAKIEAAHEAAAAKAHGAAQATEAKLEAIRAQLNAKPLEVIQTHAEASVETMPVHTEYTPDPIDTLGVAESDYLDIDPAHTTVADLYQHMANASESGPYTHVGIAVAHMEPTAAEMDMSVKDFMSHRMVPASIIGEGIDTPELHVPMHTPQIHESVLSEPSHEPVPQAEIQPDAKVPAEPVSVASKIEAMGKPKLNLDLLENNATETIVPHAPSHAVPPGSHPAEVITPPKGTIPAHSVAPEAVQEVKRSWWSKLFGGNGGKETPINLDQQGIDPIFSSNPPVTPDTVASEAVRHVVEKAPQVAQTEGEKEMFDWVTGGLIARGAVAGVGAVVLNSVGRRGVKALKEKIQLNKVASFEDDEFNKLSLKEKMDILKAMPEDERQARMVELLNPKTAKRGEKLSVAVVKAFSKLTKEGKYEEGLDSLISDYQKFSKGSAQRKNINFISSVVGSFNDKAYQTAFNFRNRLSEIDKASPVVEDIVSKIETKEESPLVETEASKALNKKLDEANTPIRIAQLTDEEKRMKISRDLTMPLLFKMDIGFIEHELRSENPNYSTLFGNLFEAWESYEASTKERSEIEDAAFVISTLPGASEAYREFVTQKDKMA